METPNSRSNCIHTQNKSIQQTCHSQFPLRSPVNCFWLINVGVDLSTRIYNHVAKFHISQIYNVMKSQAFKILEFEENIKASCFRYLGDVRGRRLVWQRRGERMDADGREWRRKMDPKPPPFISFPYFLPT